MKFEDIMKEITNGLTGDNAQDVKYLTEQMEKYKDHEMGREIVRACGRLVFKIIPDEQKEEFNKLINNDMSWHESIMEEVRFKMSQKKYDEALELMEGLVNRIEALNMFTDDQVSEYHCLLNPGSALNCWR